VFVSVRYIELGPCPPCSVQITLPCRCGESKVRPRSFLGRVESKADLSSSLSFPFLSSRVTFFSLALAPPHPPGHPFLLRPSKRRSGRSLGDPMRTSLSSFEIVLEASVWENGSFLFSPSVPLFPIQSCFSIFTPPFGCYGISRERQRNSSLTFSFSFPESQCCPLAYKGVKSKGKKRAGDLEDEDEGGWHTCSLVCGKPVSSLTLFSNPRTRREGETSERFADRFHVWQLSCGNHQCPSLDHKGPCPPCLEASYDEVCFLFPLSLSLLSPLSSPFSFSPKLISNPLSSFFFPLQLICHCRRTVVYPPIPCGRQLVCTYPCSRPPPRCGHPKAPHACHEGESCPPCIFLTAKTCGCGKSLVKVSSSEDERRGKERGWERRGEEGSRRSS